MICRISTTKDAWRVGVWHSLALPTPWNGCSGWAAGLNSGHCRKINEPCQNGAKLHNCPIFRTWLYRSQSKAEQHKTSKQDNRIARKPGSTYYLDSFPSFVIFPVFMLSPISWISRWYLTSVIIAQFNSGLMKPRWKLSYGLIIIIYKKIRNVIDYA